MKFKGAFKGKDLFIFSGETSVRSFQVYFEEDASIEFTANDCCMTVSLADSSDYRSGEKLGVLNLIEKHAADIENADSLKAQAVSFHESMCQEALRKSALKQKSSTTKRLSFAPTSVSAPIEKPTPATVVASLPAPAPVPVEPQQYPYVIKQSGNEIIIKSIHKGIFLIQRGTNTWFAVGARININPTGDEAKFDLSDQVAVMSLGKFCTTRSAFISDPSGILSRYVKVPDEKTDQSQSLASSVWQALGSFMK
jgi:hypothetical protein